MFGGFARQCRLNLIVRVHTFGRGGCLNSQSIDAFRAALNNACGEINEVARLSVDIFAAEELATVRRELARLMESIDSKLLNRLPQ